MALEVRKIRRRRGNSTEAAFEKRFTKALTKAGRTTFHTSEKYVSGIPERYVCGGIWIEFKAIPWTGKRAINPIRHFSPAQKMWMGRFNKAGDTVYGCILLQPEYDEPRILMMNWEQLRHFDTMSIEDALHFSVEESQMERLVRNL